MVEARIRALTPFWSWIPAFRAVAESEHLPTAARMLGVGPSALSRSIALLEKALGRALFARTGRTIALNDDGRLFLGAVRDAMRRLDDGVQQLEGDELRGNLRVSSGGAATTALVAPALASLRLRHPRLLPHVLTRAPGDVAAELLAGRLDVAVQEHPVRQAGLEVVQLGTLSRGVYCGRSHPLFGAESVRADAWDTLEFVAPPADGSGLPLDGWPPDQPRRVGMLVDQLRVGLDVCRDLPLLAVLPDLLAAAQAGALWRLPGVMVPPTPLFAMHRVALGANPTAALAFIDRLRNPGPPAGRPDAAPAS